MAVWREGGESFSIADLRFLEEMSLQAAIAIQNANFFNELQQRATELEIINSVQQGLSSKLDVQSIYELVGEKSAGSSIPRQWSFHFMTPSLNLHPSLICIGRASVFTLKSSRSPGFRDM
jgi:hypothetical protein